MPLNIPEGRPYVRHIADEIGMDDNTRSQVSQQLLIIAPSHHPSNPAISFATRSTSYSFHDPKLVLSSSSVSPGCCTVLFVDFNNSRLNFCKLNNIDESCVSWWISHDYYDQVVEDSKGYYRRKKKFYGLIMHVSLALIETSPFRRITVLETQRMARVPRRILLMELFLKLRGEALLVTMYMHANQKPHRG